LVILLLIYFVIVYISTADFVHRHLRWENALHVELKRRKEIFAVSVTELPGGTGIKPQRTIAGAFDDIRKGNLQIVTLILILDS
jgi:hypothetical protein